VKNAALLSSLAVDPAAKGNGAGKALVENFCAACKEADKSAVYLTTDAADNAAVNAFYCKAGFSLESQFERTLKRTMNRYVRQL
jgi:ribosomal protein S18 acetylase RimI-like enzyme